MKLGIPHKTGFLVKNIQLYIHFYLSNIEFIFRSLIYVASEIKLFVCVCVCVCIRARRGKDEKRTRRGT